MADTKLKLRLIVDPPGPGAHNMAADEAILEAVNEGLSPATLRFYRWDQPTISLGYFQKYDEVFEQAEPIRKMPVVRRQTGGGAILHDDELTYSLILPIWESDHTARGIEPVYRIVHDAFITAMGAFGVTADYRGCPGQCINNNPGQGVNGNGNSQGDNGSYGDAAEGNSQRGPFFCFARQHRLDVVVGPAKILGSAQRRVRQAVLQHGSLILDCHFDQQPCGTIAGAATKPFDEGAFVQHTVRLIAGQLGFEIEPSQLSPDETARLPRLTDKYQSDVWNRQR